MEGNQESRSNGQRKPMLHLRLGPDVVKLVDYLAVDWDLTRSEAAERLIVEALQRYDARKQRDSVLVAVP